MTCVCVWWRGVDLVSALGARLLGGGGVKGARKKRAYESRRSLPPTTPLLAVVVIDSYIRLSARTSLSQGAFIYTQTLAAQTATQGRW